MKKSIMFGSIGVLLLLGGYGNAKKGSSTGLHTDYMEISIEGGNKVSKSKLAMALVSRMKLISEVYDISEQFEDDWFIYFSVKTTSGKVYTGFKCHAYVVSEEVSLSFLEGDYTNVKKFLELVGCRTGEMKFHRRDTVISISLNEVLVQDGNPSAIN